MLKHLDDIKHFTIFHSALEAIPFIASLFVTSFLNNLHRGCFEFFVITLIGLRSKEAFDLI